MNFVPTQNALNVVLPDLATALPACMHQNCIQAGRVKFHCKKCLFCPSRVLARQNVSGCLHIFVRLAIRIHSVKTSNICMILNISPTKRFRRAVGSLDNDSDEDLEIDVSAISTPCGTSVTHHAFPSKRQKMNPVDEQVATPSPSNIVPEVTVDDDPKPGETKTTAEKKRNQVRRSGCF